MVGRSHGGCRPIRAAGGELAAQRVRTDHRPQIARSGTSVAANYRAALRAKSRADFAHKVTIVLKEADETGFWIELAERTALVPQKRLHRLLMESEELVKIFSATRRTARQNGRQEGG
jgi:four helix bundle protein